MEKGQAKGTGMERVSAIKPAGAWADADHALVLCHDERHVRRRRLTVPGGPDVLIDLKEPVVLQAGDALVLADGRHIAIEAAVEPLLEVSGTDPVHLTQLAWHIGNRHLPAAIEADRILILRDHVIAAMLNGLGATVRNVDAPFTPLRGAYTGQGHTHSHGHHHTHAAPEPVAADIT